MSGKISEYPNITKLNGLELMDFSVPKEGTPTGYETQKGTVNEFIQYHPSIYTNSSTLNGNRAIDMDGFNLYMSGGDWGVDFGNSGIMYDDLTKRVGFGEAAPSAKVHIKGGVGDDLILIEDSIGFDRFIQNETGQIGTGAGQSATISASFGQYHQATGFNFGFGFYPNNCGTGLTVQMKGTTNTGFSVAHQGNPSGIVKGYVSSIGGTNASQNYGFDGTAEDATVINAGLKGRNSNNTNFGSLINAGVYGLNDPRMNYDAHGGLFETFENNGSVVFTNVDLIGLEGRSLGGTNVANSGVKSIGSKFSAINGDENIAILIPSIDAQNDGVAVFGSNNRNGNSILQTTGNVSMFGLPTSSAGLSAGDLWNNGGVINIV